MAKPNPMSEDELRALTDSEMRQSVGYWGGKLADQRRKAEYYYLGLAKGDLSPPEIEGRSSVVSTDVRNTIESMLPQLMVKFTGGDTVVEFEATKEEDEEKAQLATDYCNYLFYKKNNGHKVAYTWMKDALLQKVGIVKVWWDNRVEETHEEYKALTDVEVAQIMDDEEVEALDHKEYPDEEDAEHRQEAIQQLSQQLQQAMQAAQQNPQAMQAVQQLQAQIQQIQSQPPKMLYDISFKRSKKAGKVTIENVPPEEFLISRRAKSIQDATFVGHRVLRTISELRSMGYKEDLISQISSDDGAATLNAERVERLSWDDEQAYLNIDNSTADESQRQVWLTECYIRCDFDGTGISELRKVVRAGNCILDNEVVDVAPFVSICPIPLPHKFFGLSIADLGMEAQRIKTNLLRARLDNEYLEVNGRYFAVEGQVNLDDLLTSRPGGVVRIKQQGAVGRLDQGQSNRSDAMELMNFMEDALENSTGWTRYSQGNDSGSLNKTATGINIVTNRSDMRTDLIARNFAEGFVDLFRMMLKLVSQYSDKEDIAKLNGNWIPVDPREWRNQFDVSINVGLGAGNKDQQVQHLMALMQVQQQTFGVGVTDAEGIYHAAVELAKNMGFKSGDKFFKDPANTPPQPPQPNPDMMKIQASKEADQAKLQADVQKHQAMMQVDQHKNEVESQRETIRLQHELELEKAKAEYATQLEQYKIQSNAELQMQLARLNAEKDIIVAGMGADKSGTVPNTNGKEDTQSALAMALQGFQVAIEGIGKPRQIVRDENGRVQGIN